MKKIILSLLLLVGLTNSYATQPEYENMIRGTLLKMKDAKSMEAYEAVANSFVRIASVETGEWLPNYYTAMTYILETSFLKDGKEIDAKLDQADDFIARAMKLGENDEILCLQSWCKSTRIMVNPMTRGQKYGMESAVLLDRAMKLNPNNPRVYFLKGQSAFYTPAEFGGGKDKALTFFKTAADLFTKNTPKSDIVPSWGKEQNAQMIAQIEGAGTAEDPKKMESAPRTPKGK